jgi:hypothetical protein
MHVVITMTLNFFKESRTSPSMNNLMDDDLLLHSKCHSLYLTSKKYLGVLDGFVSFLRKFEENKIYNMLSLMLDPNLKVSNWFHMLLIEKKGFPLQKNMINNFFFNAFEMSQNPTHYGKIWICGKHIIDEDSNLDIFEMYVGTSEPTKELVNKVLQMFRRYRVDAIDIKSLL